MEDERDSSVADGTGGYAKRDGDGALGWPSSLERKMI